MIFLLLRNSLFRKDGSGRCYTPESLEKSKAGKDKGKTVSEETVVGERCQEPVTDSEAQEFLKLIKLSEYSVVEQLNKTPAKISLLSLLLSSEPHRQALVD